MVEIHQHQPTREQLVEDRTPALLAREYLVAVEQHQFVGIGTDQRHVPPAEGSGLVNRAIRFDHPPGEAVRVGQRSEEHTSELQSLMRISYAVFCLKKKNTQYLTHTVQHIHLSHTYTN